MHCSLARHHPHTLVFLGDSIARRGQRHSCGRGNCTRSTGEAAWQRELRPDPVMLFRYSALTFNPHRIHYDQPYVTGEEGYPGLVVHGPLIATLMVDLCRRSRPDAEIKEFSFRALSPLFVDRAMTLGGAPSENGLSATVWAANDKGGLASQGEVKFA